MGNDNFMRIAKEIIANYLEIQNPDEIYPVWVSKALQNNKGLFSTNVLEGRYFEVTYNGDKDKFYVDSYLKEKNFKVGSPLVGGLA